MVLDYLRDLYLFAKYKVALNIILMVGTSFLNGVSILAIVPLLIIAQVIPAQDLTTVGWLNHLLLITGLHLNLIAVLVLYVTLLVAIAVINYQQNKLNVVLQHDFGNALSLRVFTAILSSKWQYLSAANKSVMVNGLTHEIIRVNACTILILQFVAQVLIIAVQTIIALLINPGFTILVILCAGVFGLASYVFFRKSKKQGFNFTKHNEKIMFAVNENLNGLREIKAYSLEQQQISIFAKLRDVISNNIIENTQTQNIITFIYSASSAVLISIIVFFAIKIFKLNISELIVLFLIFARLWPLLTRVVNLLNYIAYNIPAYKNIMLLEAEFLKNRDISIQNIKQANTKRSDLISGVNFKNVTFTYNQKTAVGTLNNISFDIQPGEIVACVGKSGAGKSTLADLLIGLLKPDSGQILIDNKPMNLDPSFAWGDQIGYVPQDSFLFNDSIRNNLLWSAPNKTDDDIWRVLKLSAIDELVDSLPDKLNSIVGERGVKLSGGERQRLVLARALLRNPIFLVLDEATSALDAKNEEKIQQAISQLHGKLTIFIIAHRISTVVNADKIIVLDHGRIIETGNYQTLIANRESHFSKLIL